MVKLMIVHYMVAKLLLHDGARLTDASGCNDASMLNQADRGSQPPIAVDPRPLPVTTASTSFRGS